MIKAIVFDIGGVIAYDVWEYLLLEEGRGVASVFGLQEHAVRAAGKQVWTRFATRAIPDGRTWRDLETEYWLEFSRQLSLSVAPAELIKLSRAFIRPVPGMLELLEALRNRGIELAICSDNTEFWFERHAAALGLHRFFPPSHIVLSCRVGVQKSDPGMGMFRTVSSILRADKAECLFVDDRAENVDMAVRFGLTGLLFPSHAAWGPHYLHKILEHLLSSLATPTAAICLASAALATSPSPIQSARNG